ncbi:MAG: hypothetical protein K1X81_11165 [Bacteroidia bacterium]|nr:hypothetical protein [Bacteroidia bacterium]
MMKIFSYLMLCLVFATLVSCSHKHRNRHLTSRTVYPVFDTLNRTDYYITNDTTFEVQVKSYAGCLYPIQKPATGQTEWNSSLKNPFMIKVGHFKLNTFGLVTGLALSAVSASAIQQAGGYKTKQVTTTLLGIIPTGTKTVNDGYKIPSAIAFVPGIIVGFTLNNYLYSPRLKAKRLAKNQLLHTYQVDYLLNTRYRYATQGNLLYRSAVVQIKSKGIKIITGVPSFVPLP